MQAQEILRSLRLPEFDDLSQFFRNLPATALVGIGAFAAVVAYWFASRPRAVKPPCDLRMQSEEVEGLAGARRSVIGDSPQLLTHYYDDARTMYEVFRRGFSISENGPCLGFRKPKQPYQWLSYKEVAERAEALGSGLLQQGCKPSTKQFIGVFAQNRPEWIISELACYTYSMVVVPLYDTLGPGAIRYIVNTADISTVICDKPEKARILLDHVERKETPGLRSIILMDPFEKELRERGRSCGVRIQTMQEVEDCGRECRHVPVPPRPEDLSIVCFTSGTTDPGLHQLAGISYSWELSLCNISLKAVWADAQSITAWDTAFTLACREGTAGAALPDPPVFLGLPNAWSYAKASSVWSQQKLLGAAGAPQMVGQAEHKGTPSSSISQKRPVLHTRTRCPNASSGGEERLKLLILDDKSNFHGCAKKTSALGNGPKIHRYLQTVRIQFFMLATPKKSINCHSLKDPLIQGDKNCFPVVSPSLAVHVPFCQSSPVEESADIPEY